MDAVRPRAENGERKKSGMRVALTVASAVGLVALSAHAYGAPGRTELSFDPVAAAISSHDGGLHTGAAAAPTAGARAMSLASLSNPGSQSFSEHPWDPWNPEGMPTANGKIISAAQMFDEAGEPAPAPKLKQVEQPLRSRAEAVATANRQMAGGGTLDPEVGLDLDEAFASHSHVDANPAVMRAQAEAAKRERESQMQMEDNLRRQMVRQQEQSQRQQLPVQPRAQSEPAPQGGSQGAKPSTAASAAAIRAKVAKQGGRQGFTTGSLLRVTPEEFHREMRTYMPDASVRRCPLSTLSHPSMACRPALLPRALLTLHLLPAPRDLENNHRATW